MNRAINFFHNDNKILSSYDETFFEKKKDKWEKLDNANVFKGLDEPTSFEENIIDPNFTEEENNSSLIKDSKVGDYYIQYDELGNYLKYSEDFTSEGWNNFNNKLSKDYYIKFPTNYSTKIIPTSDFSEHYISTSWYNNIDDYWCLSFYVLPDELKYFQIKITNSSGTYGVKAKFSITLNSLRRYVVDKSIEGIGDTQYVEFDDECIGVEKNTDGTYRVFVAVKFLKEENILGKFQLLRNISGQIVEEFSNVNSTAGLFINGAQLNKGKTPIKYIHSSNDSFIYYVFKQLWKKVENEETHIQRWEKLEIYNSIWYGKDEPNNGIGEVGDLYFVEPLIKLGSYVRFGKNTLFKAWNTREDLSGSMNYYTEYSQPKENNNVYIYKNNEEKEKDNGAVIVGKVDRYIQTNDYKPSKLLVKDWAEGYPILEENNENNNSENTNVYLYRNPIKDERFLKEEGIMYWNEDDNTYGYVSKVNGKIQFNNLKFNNSLFDSRMFIDAISFSTNLFNQTYSSKYSSSFGQKQLGYNSGGHYNCWDYNNLRKYY